MMTCGHRYLHGHGHLHPCLHGGRFTIVTIRMRDVHRYTLSRELFQRFCSEAHIWRTVHTSALLRRIENSLHKLIRRWLALLQCDGCHIHYQKLTLVHLHVNSTPTNTARTELHSMITFHHANTRGSRAGRLRIAHICVPKTSVIHVSCLVRCRTWHWPQAQVLSHPSHPLLLSFRQSHQHTQDLWYSIHIYPAMFHDRVADQHETHLSQVMSPRRLRPNRDRSDRAWRLRAKNTWALDRNLGTNLRQTPERILGDDYQNPIIEDTEDTGTAGADTSHLQSQMHSNYDSAESIADSDLEDGKRRKMTASLLYRHGRGDCKSSRVPLHRGNLLQCSHHSTVPFLVLPFFLSAPSSLLTSLVLVLHRCLRGHRRFPSSPTPCPLGPSNSSASNCSSFHWFVCRWPVSVLKHQLFLNSYFRNTENFVPIVVPGLSSSSSASSSTSRTPMKQESHSSSSSSSSPSSPTVGDLSVREREDVTNSDISPVPVSFLVDDGSGQPEEIQANENPKTNKKETTIELGNSCDSEIPEWLQEFMENLVDGEIPVQEDSHASSSHEASLEPTFKRREDLGKHSVYTHFPKDRNCEICKRTKITRAPCRRRNCEAVPRVEKFGDLITADHKVLSDNCESRNNHRYAVVVQDLATQWI